ncbi:hypothetical protein [Rhodococcus sp. T7]|uniref:hypothetical protein n=1 Tax=Rhodococcus sp. T7 TaxID=627444 RepID=UPI001359E5AC|nr:hypothetical protein [Rhodococcus sp. T7]KAF0957379.1 hypothetical protein MLGJGCBP_09211 [Rhodococcus sp. T7]KAF0962150.1 hypothetical protein MLGJGCBP_04771 [Rhodococcus sp. T7]
MTPRRPSLEPLGDVRHRLISKITSVAPAVTDQHAQQILTDIGSWRGLGARTLDRHFAGHPDALTVPDSHAPIGLVRLAYALDAAGHRVVLPACVRCGKQWPRLIRLAPEGRCCEWCVTREKTTICARCGRRGHPTAVRPEGAICRPCYQVDPERAETCVACGRSRIPSRRDSDGRPLCGTCARPVHRCGSCGRTAAAKAFDANGPLCSHCYQRPERECGGCGQIAPIALRGRGGGVDLCRRCRPDVLHHCVDCAHLRPAKALWPRGPVCVRCHRRAVAAPKRCAGCGNVRVLTGADAAGLPICSPCAGRPVDHHLCTTCGEAGPQRYARTCRRCSIRRRLTDLLAEETGDVREELLPLVEHLVGKERADSTLSWLERAKPAALLRHLGALTRPVSHRDLDDLAPSAALHHLRAVLVHLEILPYRLEPLGRLEPWLDTVLDTLPPHQVSLIRPYAQWSVLRRARRRAVHQRYNDQSAATDRSKIRIAIRLLRWLDDQRLTIGHLDQSRLDHWLGGNRERASGINGFIIWLSRRGLIGDDIILPTKSTARPTEVLDTADHTDCIRRLLTDTATPVTVRVAGLMVLLYGIPLTRIRLLTTEAVTLRDGAIFLTFARNPMQVPPAVAVLVTELVASARNMTTAASRGRAHYLFPSPVTPGVPLHAHTLSVSLTRLGIPTRVARNTALFTLTAELPAPVVADLLGMHIHTTTQWADYTRRDWTHYLAARNEPDDIAHARVVRTEVL